MWPALFQFEIKVQTKSEILNRKSKNGKTLWLSQASKLCYRTRSGSDGVLSSTLLCVMLFPSRLHETGKFSLRSGRIHHLTRAARAGTPVRSRFRNGVLGSAMKDAFPAIQAFNPIPYNGNYPNRKCNVVSPILIRSPLSSGRGWRGSSRITSLITVPFTEPRSSTRNDSPSRQMRA
jgi:hypothetical protein